MREKLPEDIASEPFIARGDDASKKSFKRNFVFQKLVAVHLLAVECFH